MTAMKKTSASVVKLRAETHAALQEMACEENRPMGDIVADSLQRYRKERFWERARLSVDRLKADPAAWEDYKREIAIWDGMAGDGLTDEEPYYTPEEEAEIEAEYARTYGG